MPASNPYEVLGLPAGATEAEIKSAFHRLAKRFHPDYNPGDKAAEARFKEVNAAYHFLSDSAKRKEYDQTFHAAASEPFSGETSPARDVRRQKTYEEFERSFFRNFEEELKARPDYDYYTPTLNDDWTGAPWDNNRFRPRMSRRARQLRLAGSIGLALFICFGFLFPHLFLKILGLVLLARNIDSGG